MNPASSVSPNPAPLVLPIPPPPPSAQSTGRNSSASQATIAPLPIAQAEPTVDDLLREVSINFRFTGCEPVHELTNASISKTNDCRTLVSTISTQLVTLETLRNEAISLGLGCPVAKLESLAGLTTLTGRLILSLSAPLATVTARVNTLSELAQKGQAAALASEISRIHEELETLKLEVRQNVDRVRRAAEEEYEARDSTYRRLEDRVRSENIGLGDDQIARTCEGAMNAVGMQLELVELNTYAGRVCAENPFTSLANLIENAATVHRQKQDAETLSRQGTRTSFATTLVGSDNPHYAKLELGEEGDGQENQPLAGLGEVEMARRGGKLSTWQKLKIRWRDYLVRSFLLLAVAGILVGITVFETIQQAKESRESEISQSEASAKWAPTGEPRIL